MGSAEVNRARAISDEASPSAEQTAGTQEFRGVQALRGIAALAVVAGHSTDYLQQQNGWVPAGFRWLHGPAGVDIFFVISGFVMMISAGRLLRREHPARLFLWRRVIRIAPLYWVLTALKFALISARPSLSVHARPSAWNVLASFLFVPARAADGEIRPLIPVGWTLSFEMLFYVVFAVALASRREVGRVLLPVMTAVAVLGVFRTDAWPAWTALADPIVLEFLAGVGLARMTILGRLPGRVVAWTCVVAGFAGLVLLSPAGAAMGRPLTWGISALLVVGGAVSTEGTLARRLPRWLLMLGDASYSIYLIQTFCFPVLHAVMAKVDAGFVHRSPVMAGVAMMVSSLLVSSVAGVAVYRGMERPMTEWLRRSVGVTRPEPVAP